GQTGANGDLRGERRLYLHLLRGQRIEKNRQPLVSSVAQAAVAAHHASHQDRHTLALDETAPRSQLGNERGAELGGCGRQNASRAGDPIGDLTALYAVGPKS